MSFLTFRIDLTTAFIYFRHITAPRNNALGIPKNVGSNEREKKRMLLSAQITALTTFLELFAMVTYMIHLAYMKGPSFSTAAHAMGVHCILLPYSFLMNTSHNKNRIIDNGWANVVGNIIGRSNPLMGCFNSISLGNNGNEQMKKTQIVAMTILDDKKLVTTSFNEEPSTSRVKKSKNQYDSNDIILNAKDLDIQDDQYTVSQKLIAGMTKNIEDEEKYIRKFKQLVAYEDDFEKGKTLSEYELGTEYFSDYEQTTTYQNAKLGSEWSIDMPIVKQSTRVNQDEQDVYVIDITELYLKGDIEDRILMRIKILKLLNLANREDENYKDLIKELIDLEESFIHDD